MRGWHDSGVFDHGRQRRLTAGVGDHRKSSLSRWGRRGGRRLDRQGGRRPAGIVGNDQIAGADCVAGGLLDLHAVVGGGDEREVRFVSQGDVGSDTQC